MMEMFGFNERLSHAGAYRAVRFRQRPSGGGSVAQECFVGEKSLLRGIAAFESLTATHMPLIQPLTHTPPPPPKRPGGALNDKASGYGALPKRTARLRPVLVLRSASRDQAPRTDLRAVRTHRQPHRGVIIPGLGHTDLAKLEPELALTAMGNHARGVGACAGIRHAERPGIG